MFSIFISCSTCSWTLTTFKGSSATWISYKSVLGSIIKHKLDIGVDICKGFLRLSYITLKKINQTWKVLTSERYHLGREDRCLLLIENIPRIQNLVFTFLISLFITKKSRLIRWQLSQSDQLYETDPVVSSGEEDRRSSRRPAPVRQVFRVRAGDQHSRFKKCKIFRYLFGLWNNYLQWFVTD